MLSDLFQRSFPGLPEGVDEFNPLLSLLRRCEWLAVHDAKKNQDRIMILQCFWTMIRQSPGFGHFCTSFNFRAAIVWPALKLFSRNMVPNEKRFMTDLKRFQIWWFCHVSESVVTLSKFELSAWVWRYDVFSRDPFWFGRIRFQNGECSTRQTNV